MIFEKKNQSECFNDSAPGTSTPLPHPYKSNSIRDQNGKKLNSFCTSPRSKK